VSVNGRHTRSTISWFGRVSVMSNAFFFCKALGISFFYLTRPAFTCYSARQFGVAVRFTCPSTRALFGEGCVAEWSLDFCCCVFIVFYSSPSSKSTEKLQGQLLNSY